MGVNERERRFVFGEVAELYDAARPGYPPALLDELIRLTGTPEGGHALEVGAGTGRATTALGERGLQVTALEPSSPMAAVARRRCADLPRVRIVETTFEDHGPEAATYDLIVAAQSWHWVDPESGWVRAEELLAPEGWIALLWNHPVDRGAASPGIDAAYARLLPETGMVSRWAGSQRTKTSRDWAAELDAVPGFGRSVQREHRWTERYTTEDYLRLMRTHSDHRLLDEASRETLLREVGAAIDQHGGTTTVTYVTRLVAAPRS